MYNYYYKNYVHCVATSTASILTGVMQLLSKCSESGLRGGSSQPLSRRSCRILLMSSNFSLHNIHINVDV